jgi:ribosomal protein S18 acetylase RimI-like enzyme
LAGPEVRLLGEVELLRFLIVNTPSPFLTTTEIMVQILHATLRDCLGIAETQVDSYRTAYAGLFPASYLEHFKYAEQEQDWIDLLASGTEDILLVALSEEEHVVGYVLTRAQPDIYPGYDAEIIALHVRQPFQGRGIGKALLQKAVEHLIARDCRSVMLWTLKDNRVRRWYERLNGTLLGEKSYQIEDWIIREVAYGWEDITVLLQN